jgi:hypothetical protein
VCHQLRTPEGHDPCIANLPGVIEACCGHGVCPGYILMYGKESTGALDAHNTFIRIKLGGRFRNQNAQWETEKSTVLDPFDGNA